MDRSTAPSSVEVDQESVPPKPMIRVLPVEALTPRVSPHASARSSVGHPTRANSSVSILNHTARPKTPSTTPDMSRYNPRALLCLSISNPVRRLLLRFVEWPWFDRFIVLVILLNSCFLAAHDPLDTPEVNPDSSRRDIFEITSLVFTGIFLFEAVVKIVSYGFYFGKNSYLSNSWNWLDFIIVAISVLDFLPVSSSNNLSALRTLRVLRPLRAITRFQELRFLVVLLLQCIPMLLNVLGLCAFIFFVFGILAVQLWNGVLKQRCYSTVDGSVLDPDFICGGSSAWHSCPDDYECMALHSNPNADVTSFDAIGPALLTIFQIMTYEGWTSTMYLVQDATSIWVLLYFIMLLFLGPIFAIQLFLVVISNKYMATARQAKAVDQLGLMNKPAGMLTTLRRKLKAKLVNLGLSSSGIQELLMSNAALHTTEELDFKARLRQRLHDFACSSTLSNSIMAVIGVNTIFMAMEHDCDVADVDSYCKDFKLALEIANLVFTSIFGLELLVKLAGMGFIEYFGDVFNRFDALIVLLSMVELPEVLDHVQCLRDSSGLAAELCDGGSSGLGVLRCFRLIRIVKLLRAFPSLQRQMRVVADSLSSVAWLCVLIVLFLLIFAILGMNIFGNAMWTPVDPLELIRGTHVMLRIPHKTTLLPAHITNITVDYAHGRSQRFHCALRFPLETGEDEVWASEHETDRGPVIVGVVPRSNFNSLSNAIVTVFQILTQEDWNQIMYNTSGNTQDSGLASSIYFVVLIVFGNYMLLNLFIAIIIQGFAEQGDAATDTEPSAFDKFMQKCRVVAARLTGLKLDRVQPVDIPPASPLAPRTQPADIATEVDSGASKASRAPSDTTPTTSSVRGSAGFSSPSGPVRRTTQMRKSSNLQDWARMSSLPPSPPNVTAFWILTNDNPIRRGATFVAEHRVFEGAILVAILCSSVTLAIERPGINKDERDVLDIINLVLNGVFFAEMMIKVVSLSFLIYLRNGWNRLDCFIVVMSLIDLILSNATDSAETRILRLFRIFRALRPLRVISRTRGLRIVVTTITGSVGPVLNTVAIALIVFFIFGILGVQLFSGKLHSCSNPAVYRKLDCLTMGYEWQNRDINFDHIGDGILTMFLLASQDNWPDIMWSGVDATSKYTGPEEGYHSEAILFFISFLLIGTFFVLNIFVGVFVDNFNSASQQVKRRLAAEDAARKAASGAKAATIVAEEVTKPGSRNSTPSGVREGSMQVVRICKILNKSIEFDMCIAVAIVLNVVSMALESYQPSLWQRDYLTISNFFFNYIFGLECIIKLIAERPKGYFNNNWNRFDFFIVLISFVGVAVDESGATVDLNPTILRVLRVFRIFRILRAFRIFKAAKGLQSIVEALAKSLPAIGNLAALLLLLFFIYGILSVELYGNLCTTPDVKSPNYDRCLLINEDHLLDSHASFVNIGMALLTLWRVSTGDNWGAIMISCKLAPGERVAGALDQAKHLASTLGIEAAADQIRTLLPGCVSADELNALRPHIDCGDFDCESTCGTAVSPVFFCTFLCMSNFVLLNLVIAVLMEQLEDTGDDDNAQLTPNLTRRDFARIYWRWKVNAHKVQYLKTNPGGIRAALVARDSPEPTKLVVPDPAANGGEDDDMVERVSSGIHGPIDLPTLDDEHMLFASKAAAISASATSANTTSSQASKDTVQQGGKQSNPERFSPELHALQSEGWSPMKTEDLHVDNASPVPSPNRSPSPSLDFPPTAQKALTSSQKSQNNAESPASQKALTSSQKSAEGPRYAEVPTAASELPTDIPRDAVG